MTAAAYLSIYTIGFLLFAWIFDAYGEIPEDSSAATRSAFRGVAFAAVVSWPLVVVGLTVSRIWDAIRRRP